MALIKTSNFQVCSGDQFFFDTNIWIYLFANIANVRQQKQKIYSSLFEKIVHTHNTTIWITSLVIAEYVNAVLQIGFNKWKIETQQTNAKYKRDYRHTNDCKEVFKSALDDINTIKKYTQNHSDNFHLITNFSQIMNSNLTSWDFNDALYFHICESEHYKLVTDDKDLKIDLQTIDIITD